MDRLEVYYMPYIAVFVVFITLFLLGKGFYFCITSDYLQGDDIDISSITS